MKDLYENKIEDYIIERISIYDKYSDCNVAKILVENLDKSFNEKFSNTYILYRRNILDNWTPYLIKEIHPQDIHNGTIICQHIGNNLKKNAHKNLYFRRGYYKSIIESDLLEMFNWYKPKEIEYKDKFLYVFKNELGRIKIGQAINVNQRNRNIKLQAGISIEILNIIKQSAKYEKCLHRLFKDKKYAGEWFDLNNKEIDWLVSLTRNNISSKIAIKKQSKDGI